MGDILVCPKCHERLWVGEMQIPLITCPTCLARIVNPNVAREAAARVAQPMARRQVIPLEEEANADIQDTSRWLLVLSVVLIIAAFVIASMTRVNALSGVLLLAGIAMLVINVVIRQKSVQIRTPAPPYLQRDQGAERTVIDYASGGEEGSAAMFALGFLVALGLSFLIMMGIIAASVAGRKYGVVAASVAVVAFAVFAVRMTESGRKAGFLGGLLAGFMCGAMGCGPCAMMGLF